MVASGRAIGGAARAALVACAAVAALGSLLGCSSDDTASSASASSDPASALIDRSTAHAGGAAGAGDAPSPSGGSATGAADAPDLGTRHGSTKVTTGGELPSAFPAGIPLPASYRVNMATESTGGASNFVVQLEAPGQPRALFDELTGRFAAEGWEELQKSTSNVGDSPSGSATYTNGTFMVNLGTIAGTAPDSVAVSYSVVPAGA